MSKVVLEVKVLRSKKRADTYLYMRDEEDYETLPDALQKQFGDAEAFLSFALHEDKVLATADAKMVMKGIQEQGFFLQMPVDPVLLNQMMQQE